VSGCASDVVALLLDALLQLLDVRRAALMNRF
jgi:hypothetical protein